MVLSFISLKDSYAFSCRDGYDNCTLCTLVMYTLRDIVYNAIWWKMADLLFHSAVCMQVRSSRVSHNMLIVFLCISTVDLCCSFTWQLDNGHCLCLVYVGSWWSHEWMWTHLIHTLVMFRFQGCIARIFSGVLREISLSAGYIFWLTTVSYPIK